jgi:hypothetical protein
MNALVFYCFNSKLTGSIFNAFEYYLAIKEHNPDFKLLLVDCDNQIFEVFNKVFLDRYDLNGHDYMDNILFMPLKDLLFNKFKKVLVLDYGTVHMLKAVLHAREIHLICEKNHDHPDFQFIKNNYSKVIRYSEMPFNESEHNYRMKLGFKYFKQLDKVKPGILVNAPRSLDFEFLEEINLPEKSLLIKTEKNINGFFSQFDEYVYYHANKWFDPHPRLILECAYYKKKIHYYNKYDIKDGSYYRYHDLVKNGLANRDFGIEDEIVATFAR